MGVVIALGALIGLALGALGGGGSILAVPVLVYLGGQSVSAATATSLVAVGASAAVGGFGHARAGRVQWNAAVVFVLTGVAGSWAGTRVHTHIDEDLLLLLFSGLVLVAAHRMLTACPSCTREGEETALADTVEGGHPVGGMGGPAGGVGVLERVRTRLPLKVVLAGTVVGFLTGLFGVGGGFVVVPALTLALGLTMPQAIATSLVVVAGNAAVALGFRGVGAVEWDVALPFTLTMLIGSAFGARIASKLPAKQSLRAFAVLLVLVAVGNAVAAGRALAG